MSIVKKSFGTLADGRQADLYVMTNASGASVEITNYGGIIRAINVPDKDGKIGNVVLGYNSVEGYTPLTGYLGALIGRVGNRIGNAEFELEGKTYKLFKNNNEANLHGGPVHQRHRRQRFHHRFRRHRHPHPRARPRWQAHRRQSRL